MGLCFISLVYSVIIFFIPIKKAFELVSFHNFLMVFYSCVVSAFTRKSSLLDDLLLFCLVIFFKFVSLSLVGFVIFWRNKLLLRSFRFRFICSILLYIPGVCYAKYSFCYCIYILLYLMYVSVNIDVFVK